MIKKEDSDADCKEDENEEDAEQRERQLSFGGTLDRFIHPSSCPSPTTSSSSSSTEVAKERKLRSRQTLRYAPPSQYSHISSVEPILAPDLDCIFIGINPGIATGTSQHMFAHHSNHFWKLLFRSGVLPRALSAADDKDLPRLFNLGIANLVARVTRSESELSREEMVIRVPLLESTLIPLRPALLCVVGKSIWEAIYRFKCGRPLSSSQPPFEFGWQDSCPFHFAEDTSTSDAGKRWRPRVLVMPSTSGRVIDTKGLRLSLLRDLAAELNKVRAAKAAQSI
ncbi:uracil-DNA glycosylase-like protein [Kockiozyma suomiensis]|uniref:uracil-DNA glycosylase-like protein n=1 Tax=Kockiozyma suomiensis TaxID=1337062 RepID=UPI0033440FA8